MNRDATEMLGEDDEFSLWLAACDDRLVAGDGASALDQAGVPEALRPELEREVAWCQKVRRIWGRAVPRERGHAADLSHARQASSELSPGGLGRFQLRDELGRGTFGVVYQAYDPRLRREVALKVPRAEALVSAELRARFRNEAMAAAGLDHPNIVPVFEAGEEGSVCYIASAFCPGITLAAWLRARREPVPYRVAAGLLATLAEAVDHAHRRGVLHRDLKPSNVMLEMPAGGMPEASGDGPKLVPRITDFGLAKLVDAEPGAAGATQSDVIMGSPSYMAPEQAEGKAGTVGPGADIYSLGVILYEVLTGRPPFQEDSALETLVLVRTQDPLSPSRLRPRLPRDLETICLKCLRRQPSARYPTALALADDLGRFLSAQPILARPTPAWERAIKWVRRHPVITALAGAGVCAAVTLAVVIGLANFRLKHERDRAELRRREAVGNLRIAQDAVDRMLTRVSEERLKEIPQAEPVQHALLEDALEFYRRLVLQADDDPDVLRGAGRAYRRLSRGYRDLTYLDEAERCSLQAVLLHQKLVAVAPTVAVYQQDLAISYLAQAKVIHRLGRLAEAADAVEKSLTLLDALAKADPSESAYRYDLADVHAFRAITRELAGQTKNAEIDYRHAINLLDNMSPEFTGERDPRAKSALVRNNLAVFMENEGRLDEAEAIHRRNLEFWEELLAADSASANYRSKVALTLDNLAEVLEKTGRKPEAERALRRSSALRSGLAKDYPNTRHHLFELAAELSRLAQFALERGDVGEARGLQEQSVARARSALALNPADRRFQQAASDEIARLADILIRLRLHADAAKIVAELPLLLPESAPERVRAASLLARCVPLASADTGLTDRKRAELAQAYAEGSLGLLRHAATLGYRDTLALKSDHSFDSIRSRADFQVLLAGPVAPESKQSP